MRIVDGDTIKVEWKGAVVSVRYIGMDTPETVKPETPVAWMGPEASAANQKLLDRSGGTVYLEKDVSETDRYGRLLRYVWIKADGAWLMVNLELLRLGVGQVATFPPDVKYIDPWFLDAQAAARAAAIGLWGATPRPAASPGTTAVAVCGGNKNAPGDDNLSLNGEYVVVCNRGGSAVALSGWSLTDDGARASCRPSWPDVSARRPPRTPRPRSTGTTTAPSGTTTATARTSTRRRERSSAAAASSRLAGPSRNAAGRRGLPRRLMPVALADSLGLEETTWPTLDCRASRASPRV